MAKKAKKAAGRTPTKSRKTKKAIAIKSTKAPKKPVVRKAAAKKATRRSTAGVAKLRKSVIVSSRAKKPAEMIAKELGISKAYVYALKRKA